MGPMPLIRFREFHILPRDLFAKMPNPVFERFFKNQSLISSKFNDTAEMLVMKKRIVGEKYLRQTTASSLPFFQARGNYLIMRSLVVRDQSAVHNCKHERSKARSGQLISSVRLHSIE